MIARLLDWLGLRHAVRSPGLTLLSVGAIALGVAVFLGVRIAGHTALESFRAAVTAVAGRAQLEVSAGAAGVPDSVYTRVASLPGVRAATPVVRAVLPLVDRPGEHVEAIGVDVFSNEPFRVYAVRGPATGTVAWLDWLADPRAALIPGGLARRLGVAPGDTLSVLAGTRVVSLRVHGLLQWPEALERTEQNLILMDVAALQELTGKICRLDRIDLLLTENAGGAELEETATRLARSLPGSVTIARPERRSAQVEALLGGFRLHLSALSLVALFVGMLLIGGTVTAGVVRRRREIGVLRALGLSRGGVRALVLAEAAMIGVTGVLLGVPLGLLLARLARDAIAETVSALYVVVGAGGLFVEPGAVVVAALLGGGAALVAAWGPGVEASRLEPRRVLVEGRHPQRTATSPAPLLAVATLALLVAIVVVAVGERSPVAGATAALLVVVTAALTAPAVALVAARLATAVGLRAGAPAWLAARQFHAALGRASLTVAALAAALAMVVGMTVMIASFRVTVERWIRQTMLADLYVAPAARPVAGAAALLPAEVIAALETMPGARAVDLRRDLVIDRGGRALEGAAVRFSVLAGEAALSFQEGDWSAILADREHPEDTPAILVSEPLARRDRLAVGDTMMIDTPAGRVLFRAGGVFRDYSSDAGIVLIDLEVYRRWWGDRSINSAALYLEDPRALEATRERLRTTLGARHRLLVRSPGELRRAALAIFDRTFAVTGALRLIAVVVALGGVFLTMSVLVTERRAEIGLLRAVGATRGQIRAVLLGEAGLIGIAALLAGIAGGAALAVVLVDVVLPRSFGWTVDWIWPPRVVIEALAVVVAASLGAGWWPARVAMSIEPAAALREE